MASIKSPGKLPVQKQMTRRLIQHHKSFKSLRAKSDFTKMKTDMMEFSGSL